MKWHNLAETGVEPVFVLYKAALEYAANGFKVMPLWPNTKKTMTANGVQDATGEASVINAWWLAEPNANIGLSTSGLLVLDVDCKDGVDGYASLKQLEDKYGQLPVTLSQKSPSGGRHYFFRNTSGKHVPTRKNCPAKGIDSRCDGGYITAAPSIIDGIQYVMNNESIADAPLWLVDLNIEMPIDLAIYQNGSFRGGSRVRFLFDVARECWRNGVTLQQAEERLKHANLKCEPALESKYLEIYLEIACSHGM